MLNDFTIVPDDEYSVQYSPEKIIPVLHNYGGEYPQLAETFV